MQSMKHAPLLFQPVQDNSGGDRLFPKAVPSSNAAGSVVCGWRHRAQLDNQMAQPDTKAEFVAHHYTAKRMVQFGDYACHRWMDVS
jgi:hypothetical protein